MTTPLGITNLFDNPNSISLYSYDNTNINNKRMIDNAKIYNYAISQRDNIEKNLMSAELGYFNNTIGQGIPNNIIDIDSNLKNLGQPYSRCIDKNFLPSKAKYPCSNVKFIKQQEPLYRDKGKSCKPIPPNQDFPFLFKDPQDLSTIYNNSCYGMDTRLKNKEVWDKFIKKHSPNNPHSL